ncbi:MAG: type II secretion system protein GspJ [bacterium]
MRTRPTHHIRARNAAAFTLVEVIVATILVGIISASIALVISRSVRTRSAAEARAEASQRAKSAAQSIARDLSMLVRDSDAQGSLLRLTPGPAGPDARGDLLMLSRSERAVRVQGEENEGPVHEVQYRIRTEADAPALWRREDPFPDEYIDAGGVAGPVVPGVVALKAEAFDGQAWTQDWDSDVQGLPLAVRITITASADRLDSAGAQVVRSARAVVAIDRTPMPTGLAAAPQPIQQQQNQ